MNLSSAQKSKKYTPREFGGRKIFKLLTTYFVLANLFLLSLPVGSLAQTDDSLKMVKTKNTKRNPAAAKYAKVSDDLYSELTAKTAKGKSATPKKQQVSSGTTYKLINLEFTTPLARKAFFSDQKVSTLKSAFVLTAYDRFADVFFPMYPVGEGYFKMTTEAWTSFSILANNLSLVWIEDAGLVTAPPPPDIKPADKQSQAVAEPIVRGGYNGLTGKNVIIAVLDTGIDFRHPDFITYDPQGRPTSRISYLWDTSMGFRTGRGSVAPAKFPNGTSIGTLFTKAQLTNELRAATPTIPATDLNGHGTACASVAAGNGNGDKQLNGLNRSEVVGVAPDAEIIGVRLGERGLENSFLLNAIVEWLDSVAGKTPLVISGSFGGHGKGHDGQSIQERQLNARLPLTKAGRAIVFAAGNEGNDAIHGKLNFASEAKLISWTAQQPTIIKMYFDAADGVMIYPSQATPTGDNLKAKVNPITKQIEATLQVKAGLGGVWLENTKKSTEGHFYFMDSDFGTFSPEYVSFSHLVGSPGSMENAITVGSYDWNDNFMTGTGLVSLNSVCLDSTGKIMSIEIGTLSCYSSPGPNRNGLVKPDIVAPGQWYSSALAKDNGVGVTRPTSIDSTGMYRRMNGTSAATPYTSGIIALMFEKKPTLTLGEVKNLLKGSTSKTGLNPFREALPNKNWGYGKLDLTAVGKIFASLR